MQLTELFKSRKIQGRFRTVSREASKAALPVSVALFCGLFPFFESHILYCILRDSQSRALEIRLCLRFPPMTFFASAFRAQLAHASNVKTRQLLRHPSFFSTYYHHILYGFVLINE